MPLAVYVLGLAIFAQGTSEMMLAGLLPELAADLGVSVPDAGLLISAFAIGMLVGAPVLAVLTRHWPQRRTLLGFLAVFVLAHVAAALAPNYWLLFATRAVGAFVYAGFWAVGAATAVGLAGEGRRGRAMSVVAGGLTVATVVGLPLGTVVGQQFGWRAAFWAVALLSALAMLGILATLSGGRPAGQAVRGTGEPRAMTNPRLWLAYGTTALATGALVITFSYLGPLLIDTTGLAEGWVPAVLLLYGAGSLAGITLGGRVADAYPVRTLYLGLTGTIGVSVAIALLAGFAAAAVPLVFLLGAFGFATNPVLNSQVFGLAPGAPTLAAGFNVAAFNAGITAAPWFGGRAIDAGLGYPSVAWIGAALGVLALGTVVALARTASAGPAAAAAPAAAPRGAATP